MKDCIFCKIISGEILSLKVYEDDLTIAFMDTAMDVDGHVLVVPKTHCKNILDCDLNSLNAVMQTVQKLSVHFTKHCGYAGVNLLNTSNESAGQSVPHFHIHIIPRKNDDGIDAWPKFGGAKKDVQKIYEQLKLF